MKLREKRRPHLPRRRAVICLTVLVALAGTLARGRLAHAGAAVADTLAAAAVLWDCVLTPREDEEEGNR